MSFLFWRLDEAKPSNIQEEMGAIDPERRR
jgi:hypothetical protein